MDMPSGQDEMNRIEREMHEIEERADREQTRREEQAKADWKYRVESGMCQYCDWPYKYTGDGKVTGLRVVACERHAHAIDPRTLERL